MAPGPTLEQMPLFEGLSPEELERIANLMRRRTFPLGTHIIIADQPGEVVYVVLEGTIKISLERTRGLEVILALLGPGEVVGEMSVIDMFGRWASAVTLEESTLIWMSRVAFWECLQTMPRLAFNLVEVLSHRLRRANENIVSLAALGVDGRIARQLVLLGKEYGQPAAGGDLVIPLHLTQHDLAGLVGASRVRVNQVMRTYKRLNWISVDHDSHITIHNQEALAQQYR